MKINAALIGLLSQRRAGSFCCRLQCKLEKVCRLVPVRLLRNLTSYVLGLKAHNPKVVVVK